ncbi:hypothetical protein D3C87_1729640 [compost metagenome]
MGLLKVFVAALIVSSSSFAMAAADCPAAPKDKWMPEAKMKEMILSQGYKIKIFKVSGNCYEIYGWDKEGKKVEIYYNPVDGSVVKEVKK